LEDATGDFAGFRSGGGAFAGPAVDAFAMVWVAGGVGVGGGADATSRSRVLPSPCRPLAVAFADGGEAAEAEGDAAEAACEGMGRIATLPLDADPLEGATATAGAATRAGGDVEAGDVPCVPEASETLEAPAAFRSALRCGSDSGERAD
jgi:hypothetical protein